MLPFEHQLADKLIGMFAGTKQRIAKDAPAFFDELGVDTSNPQVGHLITAATGDTEMLRVCGTLVLHTLSGRPARARSGSQAPAAGQQRRRGDGVHRARLPAEERRDAGEDSSSPRSGVRSRCSLADLLELAGAEGRRVQNKSPRRKGKALGYTSTMGDGSIVLGTIELKAKTMELHVNSEGRAERGRAMIAALSTVWSARR